MYSEEPYCESCAMINKLNNKKNLVILATILLVFFIGLGFAQPANAGWFDLPTIEQLLNDFLGTFVSNIMAPFLNFFADGLQWAIALSTTAITDNDQITELWGIIRDLVNLFFILALLVIAFGTIFDTSFGAKHILFKLLVVALLINFSYVIGAMVIEFSNIMASAFLGSIGSHGDVGSRVAQSIQPGSFYPDTTIVKELTNIQGGVEVAGRVLSSLIFAIIFMALSMIAMAVGFLLILMRIPILWVILIFAPVAWAAMIFPQTQKIWDSWRNALVEWSFVLPVYMFFIFLGVYFMNNAVLSPEQTKIFESFTLTDQFMNTMSRSIGRLFQFALSIFFLLGGAFAAKQLCGEAGSYAGKAQDWVTGKVKSGATGTAVGTAWKQFKETGQVGKYQTTYGGERARRLRQAKGQNILDPGAYEKQRSSEVETQVNSLKARKGVLSKDAWEKEVAGAEKGGGVNALAMKQLLAEEGKTVGADGTIRDATANDMVQFMQQNKGDRNPVAQKYLATMEKSGAMDKFDDKAVAEIVNAKEDSEARNMHQLRRILGGAAIKKDPKKALAFSESLIDITPSGEERKKYLGSVDWGKAVGSVDDKGKAQAIVQIKAMQGPMDESEKKILEKVVKESNPALWAESKGDDVGNALNQRLKSDSSAEIKKYISNVIKTNKNDVEDLITSMPDEDFNALIKDQSREFKEQLKYLRT